MIWHSVSASDQRHGSTGITGTSHTPSTTSSSRKTMMPFVNSQPCFMPFQRNPVQVNVSASPVPAYKQLAPHFQGFEKLTALRDSHGFDRACVLGWWNTVSRDHCALHRRSPCELHAVVQGEVWRSRWLSPSAEQFPVGRSCLGPYEGGKQIYNMLFLCYTLQ